MQATEGAAEVVAPTPETPQAAPDPMGQIVGLLQSMSEQIKSLAERVETVEQASGPHFVPSTPETYSADHVANQQGEIVLDRKDASIKSKVVPITSDGLRIPEAFLDEHPSRFGSGSRVRLNLDVVPHGRSDTKTWGELLAEKGVPQGIGVVIDRQYLSKKTRPDGRRGVWKYRIQFPKVCMPGSVQGVVSLHEGELLSA